MYKTELFADGQRMLDHNTGRTGTLHISRITNERTFEYDDQTKMDSLDRPMRTLIDEDFDLGPISDDFDSVRTSA